MAVDDVRPPFLPEDEIYDVAILGTGLTETALAGALASVGQRVVHFDANDYYGRAWASFSLAEFVKWARERPVGAAPLFVPSATELAAARADGAHTLVSCSDDTLPVHREFSDATLWFSSGDEHAKLMGLSRRFAIDLSPAPVLARGQFVADLVRSRVSKYLEFKAVEALTIGTVTDAGLLFESVPCSRSDIFASSLLTPLDKRSLMKFLKPFLAAVPDALGAQADAPADAAAMADLDAWAARPFAEYMASKSLSAKLSALVWSAIVLADVARSPNQMSTEDAAARIRGHLHSIGRYGRTAFLFIMSGTSDAVQAFARMAAVLSGTYVLGRTAQAFVLAGASSTAPAPRLPEDDPKAAADTPLHMAGLLCTAGQFVRAKTLVASADALPRAWVATRVVALFARAAIIAKGTLLPETALAMHVVPATVRGVLSPVTILQLAAGAGVAPESYTLFYLRTSLAPETEPTAENAQTALEELVRELFIMESDPIIEKGEARDEDKDDGSKPRASFVSYFCQCKRAATTTPDTPAGVQIVSDKAVDLDEALAEAQRIFTSMCPDTEFMPPMPEPEEIVWPDETASDTCPAPYSDAGETKTAAEENAAQDEPPRPQTP